LAERTIDVHREHLVRWHAVGHERELKRAHRIVEHGAVAREFFDVPEVGPGLRPALRKLVLAVREIGAERAVREPFAYTAFGKSLSFFTTDQSIGSRSPSRSARSRSACVIAVMSHS